MGGLGRFHHRLGQGRMGVDGAQQLLVVASSCRATQASAIRSVAWAPTMCTPRSSSYFFSRDHLHEAVGLADDLGLAEGGEGELADLDVVAALLAPSPR